MFKHRAIRAYPTELPISRTHDIYGGTDTPRFSTVHISFGVPHLIECAKTLKFNLIHEKDKTGVTDEELDALRSISSKLIELEERHEKIRRTQDFILRCLHSDGVYRGFIKPKEIQQAYELVDVDPLRGIEGLTWFGHDDERTFRLAEYLEKVVARIERKYR